MSHSMRVKVADAVTGYGMGMSDSGTVDQRLTAAVAALREHGAVFAYLHGSRATGNAADGSDIDVAAYFPQPAPAAFEVLLPVGVDLLVLNTAPLEIAGRVALAGVLLFDSVDDARVVWEATTRKIYADELPRISRAHREFTEAVLGRGR